MTTTMFVFGLAATIASAIAIAISIEFFQKPTKSHRPIWFFSFFGGIAPACAFAAIVFDGTAPQEGKIMVAGLFSLIMIIMIVGTGVLLFGKGYEKLRNETKPDSDREGEETGKKCNLGGNDEIEQEVRKLG